MNKIIHIQSIFVPKFIKGAFLASGVLLAIFPEQKNLGATLPAGTWWGAFIFEVILTFMLMFVVLNVSTGAKEKGITAAIAVGGVVCFEAMFAGPFCGASMNPARSIAPAVVSGQMQSFWVYLAAPTLGALLAIPAFTIIQPAADADNAAV